MRIAKLIEKRNEIGQRVISDDRKKNHNNLIELRRYEDLILEEVLKMYGDGDFDLLEKLFREDENPGSYVIAVCESLDDAVSEIKEGHIGSGLEIIRKTQIFLGANQ